MFDYFVEDCWDGTCFLWKREEYGLGSYRWYMTHARNKANEAWYEFKLPHHPEDTHPTKLRRVKEEDIFIELL